MSYTATKALADQLQPKPLTLTKIQTAWLLDAMENDGWLNGEIHASTAAAFIRKELVDQQTLPRYGHLGLRITDYGREVLLAQADKYSSASRQHHIETGKWLTFADRPEFAPPAPFKVGDIVQRIGRPGTCKYRVDKVTLTVDNTYFYDVVDACAHHYPDDAATVGVVFANCVLSTKEYQVVGNVDDDRKIAEHIAIWGQPFPHGVYIQRKGMASRTRVYRVKGVKPAPGGWIHTMVDVESIEIYKVKGVKPAPGGWIHTVVDVDGESIEIYDGDAFQVVEVTVKTVWEAKV